MYRSGDPSGQSLERARENRKDVGGAAMQV
jgi:hypothetical protein